MFNSKQFDSKKLKNHRVELHVHLEGAVRLQTVWELAQKKGFPLADSFEDFRNQCTIKIPTNLQDFLKPIRDYTPVITGDPEAIERIAYEFCEDAHKEGILYAEVRYSPHNLSSIHGPVLSSNKHCVSPRNVVELVNKGLSRGNAAFGNKVRSILCTIRGKTGWAEETVKLCHEFRSKGVVGFDIAGNDPSGQNNESEEDVVAYKLAHSLGVHRTAHAGEEGPAEQVRFAKDVMLAERIGHGYHVVEDEDIYSQCLRDNIHFEACPHSSVLTGSVSEGKHLKHPIVRFAEDGANFSINRDDPTIVQKSLDEEYEFLRKMGLSYLHLVKANFNAARNSFLPDDEKAELIKELTDIYGVGPEN